MSKLLKAIKETKKKEDNLSSKELIKRLNTQRRICGALTLALILVIIFR